MSRRRTLLIIALPLVLLAAVAAGGWWYMAKGRFPLHGTMHHDFGDVPLLSMAGATVTHTFVLENRTGAPVRVAEVRPTCSCLAASGSADEIPPGGALKVSVDLSLGEAGHLKKRVAVILADGPVLNLWVEATGIRPLRVRVDRTLVSLTSGTPELVPIHAAVQGSDDPPAEPRFDTPDAVTARFLGWKRSSAQDAERKWAAKWRGQIELTWSGAPLPRRTTMAIAIDPAAPLFVQIRGEGTGTGTGTGTDAGTGADAVSSRPARPESPRAPAPADR